MRCFLSFQLPNLNSGQLAFLNQIFLDVLEKSELENLHLFAVTLVPLQELENGL